MEEWSGWRTVNPGNLVYDVTDVFTGDWDAHRIECRMSDGNIKQGETWVGEEPYTYTDSDGDTVTDYGPVWYIDDESGNSFPTENVVAWRYLK